MTIKKQTREMKRRNFLKWSGATLLSLPFVIKAKRTFGLTPRCWTQNYWEGEEGNEYCIHRAVYDGEVDSGYIWGQIDGWPRRFKIRDVEDTFWQWNFEERIQSFEEKIEGT